MEIEQLIIEVTRKCNFACAHCLRGDAENKIINVNSVKKYLVDNNVTYINSLTLTGGEPLSTPLAIIKIVDIFKQLNISVGCYYIATNGSKFNVRSINAIAYLHTYCCDNDCSGIEISNSPWHEIERKKHNVYIPSDFEELLLNKPAIQQFLVNNYDFKDIIDIDIYLDHRQYKELIKEGRAKTGRKLSLLKDFHEEIIYINALGFVIKGYCDLSYKRQSNKNY